MIPPYPYGVIINVLAEIEPINCVVVVETFCDFHKTLPKKASWLIEFDFTTYELLTNGNPANLIYVPESASRTPEEFAVNVFKHKLND